MVGWLVAEGGLTRQLGREYCGEVVFPVLNRMSMFPSAPFLFPSV
jgi:hypothetical protein